MADKDKEDGANSIRVVDDTPEEVVRLDAPKKFKLEKKGEIAAEIIEAMHRDEVADGKEPGQSDPEQEWLNETSMKEERAVPMGWFFLLGIGLLGVVIWAGVQVFSASEKALDKSQSADLIEGKDGTDKPIGKIADRNANKEAEEHYAKTEEVLRGFLGASTPQERAKYVRHKERVLPLMEDYYSRNELKPVAYREIGEYQIFPLENLPFLAIQVKDEDDNEHPVLLEDGEDGILVDWESFVCFQPVSLDDILLERPNESTTLRAYVSSDYFYSYEFESQEKYSSFRLSFRDSELRLNGYVERGTELDEKFRKLFPNRSGSQLKPLIVTVKFLEGGRAKNSVLIESLESTVWAFPQNPAEVASSGESR